MKKPTRLSNKTSNAWSCAEDQKFSEHDFKYLYWTISKMLSWNLFTCKGTYMTDWVRRFAQERLCKVEVSSMKSTTKSFWFLIDHRQSTEFFPGWISIDRQYRPYSPVGESLYRRYWPWSIDRVDKSVNRYGHLDSCWDYFSPPIGPWLFWRCVSGHLCDHMGREVNGPFSPDFSEKRGQDCSEGRSRKSGIH